MRFSLCPGPRAWDRSQGVSGRSHMNGSSGPSSRVFDVDDSRTIFSGRTVKSSYIWAWSPSIPSGMTKNCEQMYLPFWMFLTKRDTFYFFLKKNILLSTWPGCLLLGQGPGSTEHICNFNKQFSSHKSTEPKY